VITSSFVVWSTVNPHYTLCCQCFFVWTQTLCTRCVVSVVGIRAIVCVRVQERSAVSLKYCNLKIHFNIVVSKYIHFNTINTSVYCEVLLYIFRFPKFQELHTSSLPSSLTLRSSHYSAPLQLCKYSCWVKYYFVYFYCADCNLIGLCLHSLHEWTGVCLLSSLNHNQGWVLERSLLL